MLEREEIEWCQFYWFDTSDFKLPRVLLIGDSIVAGSRDLTAAKLRGKAAVAAYSTSKIVGDPAYARELALALSEYPIDLIYFNNGLHGRGLSDSFYRSGLIQLVDMLKLSTRARLVWRSSTPITVEGNPEKLDPELNPIVLRRNRIACEVMALYGIECDDMYQLLAGHPEYSSGDGYHYNQAGYEVISGHVAELIAARL